jgi:hypothetical protein
MQPRSAPCAWVNRSRPLPETKDGTDILHITRTWQFLPGNVLRNK